MNNMIPTYNEIEETWETTINGRTEKGNLEYVASEFIEDSLYYPFNYRKNKPKNWTDHAHTFEGVIYYAIEYADTFSIVGFEEYYSKQQIEFLNKVAQKVKEINHEFKSEV